ncbi:unnamed protein product [Allacma fusca]|uniref:Uncharacterized protein n=1 Tax=Allacma fusca TaxID=39272 RepID=A0A8J2PJA8_9HEXA|nr:unnamed protein product [Allacma fusca]
MPLSSFYLYAHEKISNIPPVNEIMRCEYDENGSLNAMPIPLIEYMDEKTIGITTVSNKKNNDLHWISGIPVNIRKSNANGFLRKRFKNIKKQQKKTKVPRHEPHGHRFLLQTAQILQVQQIDEGRQ